MTGGPIHRFTGHTHAVCKNTVKNCSARSIRSREIAGDIGCPHNAGGLNSTEEK